ncbi:MAG: Periplasmic pH-dependent serine endoprotease DegQ [Myxococcota bacterium]|nr:Periplasmic pH-dependent serine endoprotease DegQ [Myxococcota bacterium]
MKALKYLITGFIFGVGLMAAWPYVFSPAPPPAAVGDNQRADGAGSSGAAVFLPSPALAHAQSMGARSGVSIADVAERAVPAVVNIWTTKLVKMRAPGTHPFFDDPMFRHFFGDIPGSNQPRQRHEKSLGSGVIVSADGLVLTNNHVIDGADSIRVTLSDKREFEAKLIGSDPKSDLAVLRLQGEAKNLSALKFTDSSRVRLGDVVLAIGNPFGVGQTVTMGIISAKGRANVGITDYEDFIQTDAAINPGNSGGALVDMEGGLVGINTAILSRSGGNQGIGFAIPANMAKNIMESLINNGRVVRGWLGVGIQGIDDDLAKALGLPDAEGVLVSSVDPGSPADKAGVKQGDVLRKLNGEKLESTSQLRNIVAALGPGKTAELEALRDGKPLRIQVTLGEQPNPSDSRASFGESEGLLNGLTIAGLGDDLRDKYNIPKDLKQGVVVTAVERESPAWEAGLREGDVIIELARRRLDSVRSFTETYKAVQGRALMLVWRQGATLYLVVRK